MLLDRYGKLLLILTVIALSYLWYAQGHSSWQGKVFSLTANVEEHLVFDEDLEAGQKIVSRLDLKQGAEDKGELILELPNNERIEWVKGYQQTKKHLEVPVETSGRYRLVLVTLPYEGTEQKTRPEVEVNWLFR